jgi:osmotically-inducible protein OsmY
MKRCFLVILSAVLLLSALSACVPLLLSGVVVGGSLVATDRRTTGTQLEDEGIEVRAALRLRDALEGRGHVNVTSYNRLVLITGEVEKAADKELVEQTVAKVDNVRSIVNEVAVTFSSTITQRSEDALISGRVKAALVDAKDLYSNAFKVYTERSVVYLMGRVTERESKRATEIARNQRGVERVVRVFELITEDELLRTAPGQAPENEPSANGSSSWAPLKNSPSLNSTRNSPDV